MVWLNETGQKVRAIVERLQADGWSLSYTCKDAGGYDQESVWEVTLARGGRSFTTEYRKGSGHRRWRERPESSPTMSFWGSHFNRGKRVEFPLMTRLQHPDKCRRDMRDHQRDVFRQFALLSEAEPPTLDEVMYCLWSDATGVCDGQSFEDWCREFGYNDDSRKAEKAYRGCVEEWQALLRMSADFQAFQELFQDY